MYTNKPKIAIVIPSLAKGGLEKVAIDGANELRKEYDITLIVMDSFRKDYHFDGKMIVLKIDWENRSIVSRFINICKAVVSLRKMKKAHSFDLVISHGELASLPNILSGYSKNIVVVHENRFAALKDIQGKAVNKMLKYLYSFKNVYRVVTVSEGIRESFIEILGLNPDKIVSIYNPYDIDDIKRKSLFQIKEYHTLFDTPVITITGRLTMAKGQWYLLRIFRELKKIIPEYKLIILGIGELKNELIDLSNTLGLKTFDIDEKKNFDINYDVYFLGFQSNPFYFVKHSKLFVMTSLWEGFGNTIVEAMICGTPVISVDCPSGPGEIISPVFKAKNTKLHEMYDDEFGILMPAFENTYKEADVPLCENEMLWVDTLNTLLRNEKKLEEYQVKGLRRAKDFHVNIIMEEWKHLIEMSINNKG